MRQSKKKTRKRNWTRNTDNSRGDNSPAFNGQTVNVALGCAVVAVIGAVTAGVAYLYKLLQKKDKDKEKEQAKTR
jgi:hypothetical protein